jgi:MFS family permease
MSDVFPDTAASKTLVLLSVFLVAITVPICVTGPAVAIPAMAAEIRGTASGFAWIINAFLLGVGSAVMLGGALADQYGRKRMFLIGAITFSLLSSVMALVSSLTLLVLLRGLHGVAGALMMTAAFAALAQEFEGPARTRALGFIGSGFGIGIAFGPIIAGVLVQAFGWRAFFVACTLVGAVVVALAAPRLRETRDPGAIGIDGVGAATFTAMLLALIGGLAQGPQLGFGHPLVVGLLVAAVALLIGFIVAERRHRRPMLDLSLFAYGRFVGAQALPVGVAYSFVVPFFLLPVRFIQVEGMSEFATGLMLLPLSAPIALVPFAAAQLTRWIPNGLLAASGLLVSGLGIAWLATVPTGAGALAFVGPLLTMGLGAGIPWGLMDDLAISVVPKERAGMATGIFGTMRVAGEAVAVAVVGAIIAGFAVGGLGAGLPADVAGPVSVAVANGAFAEAIALAPNLSRGALVTAYGNALSNTLLISAALTVAAALAAGFALRPRGAEDDADDGEPAVAVGEAAE